jgi:hypothetical protein
MSVHVFFDRTMNLQLQQIIIESWSDEEIFCTNFLVEP